MTFHLPFSVCSSCGGPREDGIVRHRPECPSYLRSAVLLEHPDLMALDADLGYWYPDPDAGAQPMTGQPP